MHLLHHLTLSKGGALFLTRLWCLLFYLPLLPQLHSVLWVGGASWLYTLTNSRLNKWEVDDGYEHQVLSWDVQKALTESIIDAIWVSANMQRHDFHHQLTGVQSFSTTILLRIACDNLPSLPGFREQL